MATSSRWHGFCLDNIMQMSGRQAQQDARLGSWSARRRYAEARRHHLAACASPRARPREAACHNARGAQRSGPVRHIFAGPSWAGWRVLLIAIIGDALTADERVVFESLSGRPQEPGEAVDEFWAAIGRRSGKTRSMAILGGLCRGPQRPFGRPCAGRARGPADLSASVWQAGKSFQYLDGIFSAVPALASMVTNKTADTLLPFKQR